MQQGILSAYFGPVELHAIGILAAVLVLMSLVYTLKRKLPRLPGSSAFWLRVHKWGALLATVLDVLHTDLYLFGLAALTMVLMLAQAVTGVVGSVIMAKLPQGEAGVEKEIEKMRESFEEGKRRGSPGTELRRQEAALERAGRQWALLLKWRMVHVPLAVFFFATLVVHVASIYYY